MPTRVHGVRRTWDEQWARVATEDDLRTLWRDGARPYVLKYGPRHGTWLEAGSGLGRYLLYLTALGIRIQGVEVSELAIDAYQSFKEMTGMPAAPLVSADIRRLPFADNAFTCYLSFGVIEHFEEGPQEALSEAYRVVCPGGMAIVVTTPNKFCLLNHSVIKLAKRIRHGPQSFFQYEYSAWQLKRFLSEAGFKVIDWGHYDLKNLPGEAVEQLLTRLYLRPPRLGSKIVRPMVSVAAILERTPLVVFGGGSVAIGIKEDPEKGRCFLCGKAVAKAERVDRYLVIMCAKCERDLPPTLRPVYQARGTSYQSIAVPRKGGPYREPRACSFCGNRVHPSAFFGFYGFSEPACGNCLRDAKNSLILGNSRLEYQWFPRKWSPE